MKIGVNVNKNTGIVLLGFAIILAGIFVACATAPNPGHDASNIVFADGKTLEQKISGVTSFSPGNILLASGSVVHWSTPDGWSKALEYTIGQGGQIKVNYTFSWACLRNEGINGYARIFVNGGDAMPSDLSSRFYVTRDDQIKNFVGNITIGAGDKIQIYTKVSRDTWGSECNISIDSFQLSVGAPAPFVTRTF